MEIRNIQYQSISWYTSLGKRRSSPGAFYGDTNWCGYHGLEPWLEFNIIDNYSTWVPTGYQFATEDDSLIWYEYKTFELVAFNIIV